LNYEGPEPTGLIFAGGRGVRFSGLKQLVGLEGKPILQHVIDTVSELDWKFSPILVLGYRKDRIIDSLDPKGIRIVENDKFEKGLSTSMKRGIKACSPGTGGYLFFLGDMPLISPDNVRAVLAEARSGASLAATCFGNKRGFPVYLHRKWKEDLLEVTGDRGARGIIKGNREELSVVDTANRGVIMDIDERNDLKRVEAYINKEGSEVGV